MPYSPELAVGSLNSEIAWLVGLIMPILLAPVSVNRRLPSGPAVISVAELRWGEREALCSRSARRRTTILRAFRAGTAPGPVVVTKAELGVRGGRLGPRSDTRRS